MQNLKMRPKNSVKVLFFDLATATGWAAGDGTGRPKWGAFTLPKTGENIGAFLIAAQEKIEKLIVDTVPDLVAFESPFINRRIDTIQKIRKLGGLANEVEKSAIRFNLPCREVSVDKVRRHFLGRDYPRKSAAAKTAVKVACRARGWDVDGDDEADALAGLDMVLSVYSPAIALKATPLFADRPKLKVYKVK